MSMSPSFISSTSAYAIKPNALRKIRPAGGSNFTIVGYFQLSVGQACSISDPTH